MSEFISSWVTGDVNGDGTQDYEPVDLQVGVITTDMVVTPGAWPMDDELCGSESHDGKLRASGNYPAAAEDYLGDLCETTDCTCRELAPPYVSVHEPNQEEFDQATVDLTCTMVQGETSDCYYRYPQPLEAMLKALTPASGLYPDGTPFFMTGTGHEDGANAGFLRDDSYLLVVVLMNKDDCSGQAKLYAAEPDPGMTRCLQDSGNPLTEHMWPITRYTDALLTLRDPNKLGFFAITGVPDDVHGTETDFAAVLENPRMAHQPPNPEYPNQYDVCIATSTYEIRPARRIVSMAQVLSDTGVYAELGSRCNPIGTPGMLRNARRGVGDAMRCDEPPLCGVGYTMCGSTCVNLETDESNCGGCGNECTNGFQCVSGLCSGDR